MRELGLKLCLFLFLVVVFGGRTTELGAVTGAATGAVLLWPLYRAMARPEANSSRGAAGPDGQSGGAP